MHADDTHVIVFEILVVLGHVDSARYISESMHADDTHVIESLEVL